MELSDVVLLDVGFEDREVRRRIQLLVFVHLIGTGDPYEVTRLHRIHKLALKDAFFLPRHPALENGTRLFLDGDLLEIYVTSFLRVHREGALPLTFRAYLVFEEVAFIIQVVGHVGANIIFITDLALQEEILDLVQDLTPPGHNLVNANKTVDVLGPEITDSVVRGVMLDLDMHVLGLNLWVVVIGVLQVLLELELDLVQQRDDLHGALLQPPTEIR